MSENENVRIANGKKNGGLYAKVKMSVKTANIMVTVLAVLLVAVTVIIVKNAGFTVKFDTDGGSRIESVKLNHSDTVKSTETPVKEGYRFAGWYKDEACTEKWEENEPVTGSMTLYAKWEKVT